MQQDPCPLCGKKVGSIPEHIRMGRCEERDAVRAKLAARYPDS